jgi:pimeloyl-ACP methyl ester carboxylesterase
MDKWSTGYFVSHGTKLHYYRTGGAKPPLVLIHGITDDGLCWTPVAEALANEYDVAMVDVRAHGKSEAPDDGYDYKTIVDEIVGLINELKLEGPIVMGHSMGAMISLTLAGLYPDLPRAILLEDPPTFWRTHIPSQEELAFRAGMIAWFNDVKRKTHDELLETVHVDNRNWPEAEFGPWIDSKHRFSLKIIQLVESPDAVPVNFSELLRQITCPALLITADHKLGAIVTDEDVAELQNSVHHIERAHIPGAGHSIHREQFTKYMEAVNSFLKKN